MKKIICLSLLVFLSTPAWAQEDEVYVKNCPTTPALWEIKGSPEIAKTNNLRRKTGSSEFASGDFVVISGRIVDENCVPITEATVEIWQNNALGLDQASETRDQNVDPNFLATGTAITDNLGFYDFFTIFPGKGKNGRVPHINFRVKHRDFQPLETEMFFENQLGNETDVMLNQEIPAAKQKLLIAKAEKNDNDLEKGIKYVFDITLEGINKYKKY
ncbi:MAG: dioxygenase [Rickettsiales bacterium]